MFIQMRNSEIYRVNYPIFYETPKISTKRGASGLFSPVASKQPVLMGHRHLNLKDRYQNLSFCYPYWDKRYTALLVKKKTREILMGYTVSAWRTL